MSTKPMFPMLDGPPITQERAEDVYRLYSCLFGSSQSLNRIAERGGFGRDEIVYIEKKHAQIVARGQCTCAKQRIGFCSAHQSPRAGCPICFPPVKP